MTQEHWNRVYASRAVESLGWCEPVPEPSLRLLGACRLGQNDPVLDIGAGASTFIAHLLAAGFRQLLAADISATALQRLHERLGAENAARVQWLVDDVTAPVKLGQLRGVALWHDRALFHFFTAETERRAYWDTLNAVLRRGGYVILAAFAVGGANRCSGLDVRTMMRRCWARSWAQVTGYWTALTTFIICRVATCGLTAIRCSSVRQRARS